MSENSLSSDNFDLKADEFQYSQFTIDCNDGRHKDVKLAYDGEEYDIEIQDDMPVVV